MAKKWATLIAALAVAFIAAPAMAATYYVATNGSDTTGDGSSGNPWATLQYAVDAVTAGDTIIVKPGTYVGCRIENLSATASAPCVLRAETALSVLLNAPNTARAKHNGILEIENYSGTVDYWEVDGFEVNGNNKTYRCIDVRVTGHITVRNCEAYQAYATGIFAAFSDYVLIEDCLSYNNGEHGIYVNNSADNGVVRGNEAYGNVSNGTHMNGDLSMGGDGVMSYWLVEDNVMHDNPATGINCDGVTDSMFRNNLIYEFGNKGFSMYAIDGAVTSKNNLILNNTVLSDSGGLLGYYDVFIHRNKKNKGNPTGFRIYNNILHNYRTATNRGSICIHDSAFSDFDSDYNAVMEYFGINDNKDVLTFAEWQALGYDTNSIQETDTTLFDDPANHVYTLKTGSGAIDGGTTLTDVTDDINGVSRPQGSAYDMGCYED